MFLATEPMGAVVYRPLRQQAAGAVERPHAHPEQDYYGLKREKVELPKSSTAATTRIPTTVQIIPSERHGFVVPNQR
jgi:hypothetical protein